MIKVMTFITIFIMVLSCSERTEEKIPVYFPYDYLDSLNLGDIYIFWNGVTKIDTICNTGSFLGEQNGFIVGRTYLGGNQRIWMTVFDSTDNALNAMHILLRSLQVSPIKGSKKLINTEWWYNEDAYNVHFWASYLNTVIELHRFKEGGGSIDNLLGTFIEIQDHMDNFCIYNTE